MEINLFRSSCNRPAADGVVRKVNSTRRFPMLFNDKWTQNSKSFIYHLFSIIPGPRAG